MTTVLFPEYPREVIAKQWPTNPWGFGTDRPLPMVDRYDATFDGAESLDLLMEHFPWTFVVPEHQTMELVRIYTGLPQLGWIWLEDFVTRECGVAPE